MYYYNNNSGTIDNSENEFNLCNNALQSHSILHTSNEKALLAARNCLANYEILSLFT